MKKITILDTSVATKNVGDEIIVDSVKRELYSLFKSHTMFFKVPTHEVISRHSRRIINASNFSFVAGTNLLSSKHNVIKANQWNINLYDAFNLNNVVLIGAGWTNYQQKSDTLSKIIYKNVLDSKVTHSVRDNYTKNKLNKMGINNVVNTGCPTMWGLTPKHCAEIPTGKSKNVIMTLTDYRADIEKDELIIDILLKNYEKVYVWIQGSNDADYIQSLSMSKNLEIISPTLEAFDEVLDSEIELDYVGTRLHAGIRAMQKKRRSIIIGVDNRALEKERDFNIKVINRENLNLLEKTINEEFETIISLDFEAIIDWKKQFKIMS